MKALVECFIEWLDMAPSDLKVWKILKVMATETLARADLPNQQQREIEVLDVANLCQPERSWEYNEAKQWFNRANPSKYLEGRTADLDAHFLRNGHTHGLKLQKRESAGGHRAPWYFEVCELTEPVTVDPIEKAIAPDRRSDRNDTATEFGITYGVTKPGDIELSWFGRLVLGDGAFKTKSVRGLLWATWMMFSAIGVVAFIYIFLTMGALKRPIQTNDVVVLVGLVALGWLFWRMILRPMIWLLDDRLILASDSLMKLKEDSAQLDMRKDEHHRYIRLVRYSASCPICAGNIELRYGQAQNHRRIFACCSEVPAEHVFTFDRVTLTGNRYLS